jgi:hypothetical protein
LKQPKTCHEHTHI